MCAPSVPAITSIPNRPLRPKSRKGLAHEGKKKMDRAADPIRRHYRRAPDPVLGSFQCKLEHRRPTTSRGLQPVPAWHPPLQFEFRDSSGSTGGGFHRKPSACTVARLRATHSNRSAASPSEYRNRVNRNARRAYAFRQEHFTEQKSSVHVVPHAIRRL